MICTVCKSREADHIHPEDILSVTPRVCEECYWNILEKAWSGEDEGPREESEEDLSEL